MRPMRKGDLVVVIEECADYVIGQGTTRRTRVQVGVASSCSRDGATLKTWTACDGSSPQPFRPRMTVWYVTPDRIDIPHALTIAAAHKWPGHEESWHSARPYDTLAEARDALRPALIPEENQS